MQISQFFLNGDMKGALAYMRSHEAFKEILPAYTAIFEDCKYRTYEIPDMLRCFAVVSGIFPGHLLLRLTGGGGRRQAVDRAEASSEYAGCR